MSSAGFKQIPTRISRNWTTRQITTTAKPSDERVTSATYASPIVEIELTIQFLRPSAINELQYMLDDTTFDNEWEFAEGAWQNFEEAITAAVTTYNKGILEHAKDLGLTNATVIGKAKTHVSTAEPDEPLLPIHELPTGSRFPSTRAPSIRTIATTRASSSNYRRNPNLLSWLASSRK